MKDLAYKQPGTVGSGNHYVDVFVDNGSYIWIGVHFGSRGFGHKIATHYMKRAGAKDGMMVAPCVVSENSEIGIEYIQAMNLAGKYAYAGRDWVCDKVFGIIKSVTRVAEENKELFEDMQPKQSEQERRKDEFRKKFQSRDRDRDR